MAIWQIGIFVVIAAGIIAGLVEISKAVQKLGKGITAIEVELKRMNGKLETVEAVSKDSPEKPVDPHDNDLEAIEAAISNFEKLKRVDLTQSQQ